MKKFFVSFAFMAFLALFGGMLSVSAGEPGIEGAELNGDTNCDGTRDLSDAITLLNWLYVGGGRPCPLAEPVGLRDQVADLESRLAERNQRVLDLEAQLERTTLELGDQLADANRSIAVLRLELGTLQDQADDCCESEPGIVGGGALFADDFARNNGDLGSWTPLGNNWPRNQGDWRIENQNLVVTWPPGNPLEAGNRSGSRSTWLWAGDPVLTLPEEFELTFDVEFVGIPNNGVGRFGGITFCSDDSTVPGIGGRSANGYQLEWRDISLPGEDDGHHGFTLFDSSAPSVLIARGAGNLSNPPREMRIVVNEATIEIWGDGERFIQVENSNHRRGHFGFFGAPWRGSIVFDNVVVQEFSDNLCGD